MASIVSDEQRQRIEANRAAAIIRRHRSIQSANAGEKCHNTHTVSLQLCSAIHFFVATPHSCCDRVQKWLESVPPLYWKPFYDHHLCAVYRLRDYDVVTDVLQRFPSVKVEHIPWSSRKAFSFYSPPGQADQWIPFHSRHVQDSVVEKLLLGLPWKLKRFLLPFQWDGIRYGLRRGGRVLIADEMGLGKTVQAIAIAACYLKDGPLLVVCPASLRLVWAEELERWVPFLLPSDIHLVFGREDDLKELDTPKVVIISYNMLRRLRESIARHRWETVIIDESHNMRCSKRPLDSEETRALIQVARDAPRAVFLSGTPSLSRPFDIYNQIDTLWSGILGKTKYDFARSYCGLSSNSMCKDYTRGVRLEELNVLLRETVMIRRLKDQILTQLPPKRRQVIRLRLSPNDILGAKASLGTDQIIDEDKGKLTEQETGIAKLKGVIDWLSNNPFSAAKEEMQKIIIFGHHLRVLNSIQEFVVSKEIEFIRIDGQTDAKDRQRATGAFKRNNEVKVAIVGVTAGGVGLDLSAAQVVVFAELPRTASELVQAEDRAHRRGQKNAVNVYIFCAKETADEYHWQSLSRSLERVSTMTNGSEDAIPGLQVETLVDQSDSGDTTNFSFPQALPCPEQVGEENINNPVSETVQQNAPTESENFDASLLMFESSANTGRIHLYVKTFEDPFIVTSLNENFQPEDLEKIKQLSEPEKDLLLPACLFKDASRTGAALAFIQEWKTLRPVLRKKLYGRPLQLPLSRILSRLTGVEGGLAKGGSKRRWAPRGELDCPLPDGASWKKVCLSNSTHVLQAMAANGIPLCKQCYGPCTRPESREPNTFEELFCKFDCFEDYRIKTSSQHMREKLFRLERGICVICNLDCHALVECIRNLNTDLRKAYILQRAPAFGKHEALLQNLIQDPIEGNAWHADHIIPVFAGGGECNLENMRTLCVVCHLQVTSEQCRQRSASFHKAQRALNFTIEKLLRTTSEEEAISDEDDDRELLGIEIAGSAYSGTKQTG